MRCRCLATCSEPGSQGCNDVLAATQQQCECNYRLGSEITQHGDQLVLQALAVLKQCNPFLRVSMNLPCELAAASGRLETWSLPAKTATQQFDVPIPSRQNANLQTDPYSRRCLHLLCSLPPRDIGSMSFGQLNFSNDRFAAAVATRAPTRLKSRARASRRHQHAEATSSDSCCQDSGH